MEKVMIGIASIPERERSLKRVIASLAPQADWAIVSLNDYQHIPGFLRDHENVEAVVRDGANGGDAEKFAGVDDWDGYVLTVDDDVLYPDDYVQTVLAGIERYGRDAVVGFHGGTTLGWNGAALAATHKQIRCLGHLDADDPDVNVLGTGAMGYHTSRIPLWRDVFRHRNMADVHMACHARTLGIPMVALAHDVGWLKDICPTVSRRIYESNKNHDGSLCDTTANRQLELDRIDWDTPAPTRPRVRVSISTCSRPELLGELLIDLDREASWVDLEVAVYEDPSDADYTLARGFCERPGWEWHTFPERLGREEYWRLVGCEFRNARGSKADWFVFLPDDVRLVRHAIPRALTTWQLLEDPATLTLWRLKDHENQTNWTGLLPVQREHGWEVFHVDCIYLCRRDTLNFLHYRCPPVQARRLSSSGVGRAMSLRLHAGRKRMYRVNKSLALPVSGVRSIMNPDVGDRRYPGVAL